MKVQKREQKQLRDVNTIYSGMTREDNKRQLVLVDKKKCVGDRPFRMGGRNIFLFYLCHFVPSQFPKLVERCDECEYCKIQCLDLLYGVIKRVFS